MLYNINNNNYISVLDIQLWMIHCLLIYYAMREKASKYQIRTLSTMQILDLTQSVHAKISIGMHQGVKL
jgi:hypothetical protein